MLNGQIIQEISPAVMVGRIS